jgi:hypothetical protein
VEGQAREEPIPFGGRDGRQSWLCAGKGFDALCADFPKARELRVSRLVVARVWPSRLKVADPTAPSLPVRMAISAGWCGLATFQNVIGLPVLKAARVRPSGWG